MGENKHIPERCRYKCPDHQCTALPATNLYKTRGMEMSCYCATMALQCSEWPTQRWQCKRLWHQLLGVRSCIAAWNVGKEKLMMLVRSMQQEFLREKSERLFSDVVPPLSGARWLHGILPPKGQNPKCQTTIWPTK